MEKKILAIIPARGGSKSIKKKNIVPINGIPLVGYTIKEALKSKLITHLCLSTDNKEIASIAKKYKCPHLVMRDYSLANDLTKTFPVVLDALEKMEKSQNIIYDLVILLQPTSPFRNHNDIDLSLKKLISNNNASSLISVVKVISHHPMAIKKIEKGFLKDFCLNEPEGVRRQDYLPQAYIRNGAIYASWKSTIKEFKSLYGPNILPYEMPEERSINIDGVLDLYLAEALINKKIL